MFCLIKLAYDFLFCSDKSLKFYCTCFECFAPLQVDDEWQRCTIKLSFSLLGSTFHFQFASTSSSIHISVNIFTKLCWETPHLLPKECKKCHHLPFQCITVPSKLYPRVSSNTPLESPTPQQCSSRGPNSLSILVYVLEIAIVATCYRLTLHSDIYLHIPESPGGAIDSHLEL